MSASIPQVRALSEPDTSEVDGPLLKKPRLDEDVNLDRGMEVDALAPHSPAQALADEDVQLEEPEVIDEAILNQNLPSNKSHKKNKKKKREPPMPEPCSPSDVLYREIKGLLGEDAVDRVTKAGDAFKTPYERGEEVVVKIEMIESGGTSSILATVSDLDSERID